MVCHPPLCSESPDTGSSIAGDLGFDEAKLTVTKARKNICTLSLNIRSLNKNWAGLQSLVAEIPFKIILLQETWCKTGEDRHQLNGFHNLIESSRTGRGGGVGAFVHSTLAVEMAPDFSFFEEGTYESQAFKITSGKSSPVNLVNVYRPPTGDCQKSMDLLDKQLERLANSRTDAYLFGDLNIDWLTDNSQRRRLSDMLQQHGFRSCVLGPTRVGATLR